jgi:hypothetical protein
MTPHHTTPYHTTHAQTFLLAVVNSKSGNANAINNDKVATT